MADLEVISVNLREKVAVLSDDSIIRITNLFDMDGDEPNTLPETVAVIAGPDKNGKWHNIDYRKFRTEKAN